MERVFGKPIDFCSFQQIFNLNKVFELTKDRKIKMGCNHCYVIFCFISVLPLLLCLMWHFLLFIRNCKAHCYVHVLINNEYTCELHNVMIFFPKSLMYFQTKILEKKLYILNQRSWKQKQKFIFVDLDLHLRSFH